MTETPFRRELRSLETQLHTIRSVLTSTGAPDDVWAWLERMEREVEAMARDLREAGK